MTTLVDDKDLSQKVLNQISEQPGVQLSAVLPGTDRKQVKQIIADLAKEGVISEELKQTGRRPARVFYVHCNEPVETQKSEQELLLSRVFSSIERYPGSPTAGILATTVRRRNVQNALDELEKMGAVRVELRQHKTHPGHMIKVYFPVKTPVVE